MANRSDRRRWACDIIPRPIERLLFMWSWALRDIHRSRARSGWPHHVRPVRVRSARARRREIDRGDAETRRIFWGGKKPEVESPGQPGRQIFEKRSGGQEI